MKTKTRYEISRKIDNALWEAKSQYLTYTYSFSRTMSKIITVVGATGSQGGSVIRTLLGNKSYKLRAITRDPASDAAKALVAQGVEVVKADANDVVLDLQKIFSLLCFQTVERFSLGKWAIFDRTLGW